MRRGGLAAACWAALACAGCPGAADGEPEDPQASYVWAESGDSAPPHRGAAGVGEPTRPPAPPAADEPGAEEGPAGTLDDPIPIFSFPFVDSRDTTEAPSPVFDLYGCALETHEGGGGYVYAVTIIEAGELHAALDDQPGDDVDIDLHLLTEPSPDACVIRDNVAWSFPVTPGTYLLVADTWQPSGGDPLAGPYTLAVDFVPTGRPRYPEGTLGHPIVVDGFPYTDTRDTAAAPSDAIDVYSCAPSTDESGPEFVYTLGVPVSGTLHLGVEVLADDTDVDVHLLSALDGDACVARDDTGLSAAVEAGTWFVVADTWVDGAGTELAGPYELTIDFEPDAPPSTAPGSSANPLVVDAFPWVDARTTVQAPQALFDSYACAPLTDESGKEVVYRLDIPSAGVLTAAVNDVAGDSVDVDVHLLSDLDPEACLARDNHDLAWAVEPGTLWLTVDTWVNGSGEALAGSYVLRLDLIPHPDLESGCLVLYGDTRGGYSGDPQLAHQAVVAAILDRCPGGTLLHSGDLVRYGSGPDDWADFVAIEQPLIDAGGTLYPVRGNHDGWWPTMMDQLGTLMPEPPEQSTYKVALNPLLTFVALDSEGDAFEQAGWLESRLSAEMPEGHRWIVSWHRPLFPSIGGHSGYSAGEAYWWPIVNDYPDDVLVLTGHNHGLSREVVKGVTLVTSGGAGAPLYGCGQIHDDTRYCASSYGYTVCDLSLTCVTWEVDLQAGTESIGDAFTLAKDG